MTSEPDIIVSVTLVSSRASMVVSIKMSAPVTPVMLTLVAKIMTEVIPAHVMTDMPETDTPVKILMSAPLMLALMKIPLVKIMTEAILAVVTLDTSKFQTLALILMSVTKVETHA
jgi:hypothetical protein